MTAMILKTTAVILICEGLIQMFQVPKQRWETEETGQDNEKLRKMHRGCVASQSTNGGDVKEVGPDYDLHLQVARLN